MSLSRRPSAQFFTAFYRWSRHTRQTARCVSTSIHQQPHEPDIPHRSHRDYDGIRKLGSIQVDKAATSKNGFVESGLSLPEGVREFMRKVPSSVAVVTVAHRDPDSNTHVPMGVAVSSLTTVTLDPPIISFNLKQPSQTLDAIREAGGRFRVHFVAGNSSGAGIVDLFSKGNRPETWKQRTRALDIDLPSQETSIQESRLSLAPTIRSKAVQAVMDCSLSDEFLVSDHLILVANVDKFQSKFPDKYTLMYVDRTFMESNASKTKPAVITPPEPTG